MGADNIINLNYRTPNWCLPLESFLVCEEKSLQSGHRSVPWCVVYIIRQKQTFFFYILDNCTQRLTLTYILRLPDQKSCKYKYKCTTPALLPSYPALSFLSFFIHAILYIWNILHTHHLLNSNSQSKFTDLMKVYFTDFLIWYSAPVTCFVSASLGDFLCSDSIVFQNENHIYLYRFWRKRGFSI